MIALKNYYTLCNWSIASAKVTKCTQMHLNAGWLFDRTFLNEKYHVLSLIIFWLLY